MAVAYLHLGACVSSEAAFRGRFVFEGIPLGVYAGHRAAPGAPGAWQVDLSLG
jgi:hypothetical protein